MLQSSLFCLLAGLDTLHHRSLKRLKSLLFFSALALELLILDSGVLLKKRSTKGMSNQREPKMPVLGRLFLNISTEEDDGIIMLQMCLNKDSKDKSET